MLGEISISKYSTGVKFSVVQQCVSLSLPYPICGTQCGSFILFLMDNNRALWHREKTTLCQPLTTQTILASHCCFLSFHWICYRSTAKVSLFFFLCFRSCCLAFCTSFTRAVILPPIAMVPSSGRTTIPLRWRRTAALCVSCVPWSTSPSS